MRTIYPALQRIMNFIKINEVSCVLQALYAFFASELNSVTMCEEVEYSMMLKYKPTFVKLLRNIKLYVRMK